MVKLFSFVIMTKKERKIERIGVLVAKDLAQANERITQYYQDKELMHRLSNPLSISKVLRLIIRDIL